MRAIGTYLSLYKGFLIKNDFPEFLFNFPEIQIAGILLCCNDDIISLGETGLIEPEEFSNKALDPIPFDRVSCLLAYTDPQSRKAQPVLLENDSKVPCVKAFPRSVYIDKISAI